MKELFENFLSPWENTLCPPDIHFNQVLEKFLKSRGVYVAMQVMQSSSGCLYGSINAVCQGTKLSNVQVFLNHKLSRGPRAQLVLAHELGHYFLHYEEWDRYRSLSLAAREVEAEWFSIYLYSTYYGVMPEVCRQYLLAWGGNFPFPNPQAIDLIQTKADPLLERLFNET